MKEFGLLPVHLPAVVELCKLHPADMQWGFASSTRMTCSSALEGCVRPLALHPQILPRDGLTLKSESQPGSLTNTNSSAYLGGLVTVMMPAKDRGRSRDELICDFIAKFEAILCSDELRNENLGDSLSRRRGKFRTMKITSSTVAYSEI